MSIFFNQGFSLVLISSGSSRASGYGDETFKVAVTNNKSDGKTNVDKMDGDVLISFVDKCG